MCSLFPPAGDCCIDWLDLRLRVLAGRQIIDLAAVEPIADADFDLVEAVEDVELGQRQTVDAARPHRLPHQHGIEPTAASRPAGHDAEFLAAFTQHSADLVLLFRGERTLADPRRIGLAYAEHIADRAWSEPRSCRRLRRYRIRGCDKWIGAMIDIEQCALSAFKQDALALAAFLIKELPDRIHVWQYERRHLLETGPQLRSVDRRY